MAEVLTDAQIERFSRQILLPEVGGRGQARLLDARVSIEGAGPTVAITGDLLARAGVGVAYDATPQAPALRVELPDGAAVVTRWTGERLRVATTTRAVCATCRTAAPTPQDATDVAATEQLMGALVASECLHALLGLSPRERALEVDLAASACAPVSLAMTAGCPLCADLP